MSIEDLLNLVPPPETPVDPGSAAEWAAVERELGTELPLDYKSYIRHYGMGVLAEWIMIYNPFSNTALGLLPAVQQDCEILRMNQSDEIIDLPYAIYPETPGLLPRGKDHEGGTILWLTMGAPEEWPIVVVPRSLFEDFPRFDMPLTEFLVKLIRKEIALDAWDNLGDGDPARLRSFEPF